MMKTEKERYIAAWKWCYDGNRKQAIAAAEQGGEKYVTEIIRGYEDQCRKAFHCD